MTVLAKVRASSWGELFDCPLRWYSKNVLGLRNPTRGAMQIGTAIHKGTAVFDGAMLTGMVAADGPVRDLVEASVNSAVEAIDKPTDEDGTPTQVEYDEEVTQGQAKDYAVKLTAKYCREVAPAKTYTAVEVKCVGLDVATEEGVIRLSGTGDRVEKRGDQEGIVDLKTGATAVGADGVAKTAGHHLQLGIYTLLSEAELKRPLGAAKIIGFQTSSKLRIGEGIVENPKRALVGDGDNPGLIEVAAKMLKSGLFPPNPKSMLCSEKYCPNFSRCIYHN